MRNRLVINPRDFCGRMEFHEWRALPRRKIVQRRITWRVVFCRSSTNLLCPAMLVVGVSLGSLTACDRKAAELRTAYVTSINPSRAAHACRDAGMNRSLWSIAVELLDGLIGFAVTRARNCCTMREAGTARDGHSLLPEIEWLRRKFELSDEPFVMCHTSHTMAAWRRARMGSGQVGMNSCATKSL